MFLIVKYGIIFLISLKLFVLQCNGDRTIDRMYIDIKASTSCFRRLNATHQVGCSSNRGGSLGVIHFCTKREDLQFIVKNGSAGPYVPVLPVNFLDIDTVKTIRESSKISGLLLYLSNEALDSFTHDKQCPNENFAVPNTCGKGENEILWNPHGTGLLFQDINFPIFYIDNFSEIDDVKNCFQRFNNYSFETQKDRSLCSVQLNSFMYAAKNTPTCVRRSNVATNLNPMRVCDPLGDKNVWATLFPLANYNETTHEVEPILGQKYVVIAARADTASLFDRTSGADSPITGLVTFLTIAKILKHMIPKRNNSTHSTNVLFIVFNGESFDYIGSQRMVYDMEKGSFPLEFESGSSAYLPVIQASDISLFIELSQLSKGNGHIYAHRYKVDERNTKFINLLKNNTVAPIVVEVSNGTLPPSSSQTFVKKYSNLSTVVITNHQKKYSNKFYNSIFDNSSNIQYTYFNNSQSFRKEDSLQKHLLDIAVTVSKSVYTEVTGIEYQEEIEGEIDLIELVDELLHCYLEDQNCKINQAIGKIPQEKQEYPLNLYVGVDSNANEATTLLGFILGWFTGDVVGESNQNCTNMSDNYAFRFFNMSESMNDINNTKCFRMVMNFTDAVSPAFIIDDYDWSTNMYSSWSESTWGDINMRLYLKPSAAHESMTMAIGCISLIFSFLIVYFIKSRSHILFTPESVQPTPVDC